MSKRRGKASAQPQWRNRIVESGTRRAGDFVAHPDNWRTHSSEQEALLVGVLETVGWVQDVIESKRTGYVLDGHLRVKAALARGEDEPVPYKVVDVTEAEEALILSTFDPLSALAGRDREKVAELLDLIPDSVGAELARALHSDKKAAKKLVAFDAAATFHVVVECENETQQAALVSRLRAEGYTCRTE